MRRKRGGCILMVLGAVVALVAGVLAFYLTAQATVPKAVEVPKRDVLIAAVNIPERTLITPNMLRVQQWPLDVVPPGALSTTEDGANRFSIMPIYAGQALLKSQIADTQGKSGPAYALENGKVLVAVNFPNSAGIVSTGAVKAGDSVDLIVTMPGIRGNQVAPTIQNLKVYAIGSLDGSGKGSANGAQSSTTSATLFVFQVDHQDALILEYLETLNVDVALRPAADDGMPPTEPVNIDYIINKYRLQRPTNLQ